MLKLTTMKKEITICLFTSVSKLITFVVIVYSFLMKILVLNKSFTCAVRTKSKNKHSIGEKSRQPEKHFKIILVHFFTTLQIYYTNLSTF